MRLPRITGVHVEHSQMSSTGPFGVYPPFSSDLARLQKVDKIVEATVIPSKGT